MVPYRRPITSMPAADHGRNNAPSRRPRGFRQGRALGRHSPRQEAAKCDASSSLCSSICGRSTVDVHLSPDGRLGMPRRRAVQKAYLVDFTTFPRYSFRQGSGIRRRLQVEVAMSSIRPHARDRWRFVYWSGAGGGHAHPYRALRRYAAPVPPILTFRRTLSTWAVPAGQVRQGLQPCLACRAGMLAGYAMPWLPPSRGGSSTLLRRSDMVSHGSGRLRKPHGASRLPKSLRRLRRASRSIPHDLGLASRAG